MGIFDFLKKKSSQKVADNGALALDELPPIPSQPESDLSQDVPAMPESGTTPSSMPEPLGMSSESFSSPGGNPDGLPPSPSAQELSQPVNSDKPVNEAMDDLPQEGLEVPSEMPPSGNVNHDLFEKLNADLAAANNPSHPSMDMLGSDQEDAVPSKEEIEEVLLANKEDSDENESLPDFSQEQSQDDEELEAPELTQEDAWTSQEEQTLVKTESLLLKSIFVEREHYANLLFSLRTVKDDLEKSGPQQRKLSNIDIKLGKEYSKLSTLFENFNENIMTIEHIVSNEKF